MEVPKKPIFRLETETVLEDGVQKYETSIATEKPSHNRKDLELLSLVKGFPKEKQESFLDMNAHLLACLTVLLKSMKQSPGEASQKMLRDLKGKKGVDLPKELDLQLEKAIVEKKPLSKEVFSKIINYIKTQIKSGALKITSETPLNPALISKFGMGGSDAILAFINSEIAEPKMDTALKELDKKVQQTKTLPIVGMITGGIATIVGFWKSLTATKEKGFVRGFFDFWSNLLMIGGVLLFGWAKKL